jgi:hypothetical protein
MEMVFIIYWNLVFIVTAAFKNIVFSFEPYIECSYFTEDMPTQRPPLWSSGQSS